MTLARHTLVNYVSHGFVALAGLLGLVAYVRFVDAETYGLIAFYGVLQTWFMLLDLGLGATVARETARHRAAPLRPASLTRLLRRVEQLLVLIGAAAMLAVVLGSGLITHRWLKIESLDLDTTRWALQFMAGALMLRFVTVAHRSVLTGTEDFVRLSLLNVVFATLRFLLVIPLFMYVSQEAVHFFAYQLVVAALEVLVMRHHARLSLNKAWPATCQTSDRSNIHNDSVSSTAISAQLWRFAASAGATAALWIAVTQVDRLLLSILLPLAQFGYFSLAIVVANSLFVASTPITTVLLARMSLLNASGKQQEVERLYHAGTQVMAVVCLPVAGVCWVLAGPVLWLLTGNPELARTAEPVLAFYAIGNACLMFAMCPYLLLYAKGHMGLHVVGQLLLLGALAPAMAWAALQGGIAHTGPVWMTCNALYLLLWVPVIHGRHWPGGHLAWLKADIAPVALPVLLLSAAWQLFAPIPTDRGLAAVHIAVLGSLLLLAATVSSPVVRQGLLVWRARHPVR